MILVDTNVISELLRPSPEPRVIKWVDAQLIETLYLGAINVAELRFGVALMSAGKRRDRLYESLEKKVFPLFVGRILPFDMLVSEFFAELMAKARVAGLAIGTTDGYIAATAAANGMMVATRDTSPFEAVDVPVINPWRE